MPFCVAGSARAHALAWRDAHVRWFAAAMCGVATLRAAYERMYGRLDVSSYYELIKLDRPEFDFCIYFVLYFHSSRTLLFADN
jgi:hypothetical protein